MSEVWSQSRYGQKLDLVEPRIDQVDFWEICKTLASINRYGGSAEPDISVAFHTLVAFESARMWGASGLVLAYVLAHDMHEARIGDFTTPVVEALMAVADDVAYGSGQIVGRVIKTLKGRHDRVIWEKAGLAPPTPEIVHDIKKADLIALRTERRDFMSAPPAPWHESVESVEPSPTIYKEGQFGHSPTGVAWNLYLTCERYFPAFHAMRAAA